MTGDFDSFPLASASVYDKLSIKKKIFLYQCISRTRANEPPFLFNVEAIHSHIVEGNFAFFDCTVAKCSGREAETQVLSFGTGDEGAKGRHEVVRDQALAPHI